MAIQPDALLSALNSDLDQHISSVWSVDDPSAFTKGVAAILQRDCLLKKLATSRTSSTRRAALDTFLNVNKRCKDQVVVPESDNDKFLLGQLRENLYRFFYKNGDQTILDVPLESLPVGFGPGSSFGSVGSSLYEKVFDGPIASTSDDIAADFTRYAAGLPHWLDAEIRRTLVHGNPVVVKGSKLSFVAKNNETDRTINIEPACNMLFQLAFHDLIHARLASHFGVDFARQQGYNRRLALMGSTNDRFITVDLKSASDSLAIPVMEYLLPRAVFTDLMRVRSPFIQIDGSWHELHMIGTMGNGFTFALQTALFACCVQAAATVVGIPLYNPTPNRTGNWAVYGDDIIVQKELETALLRLLNLLGFTVNLDKTFTEGPFRESCGIDCLDGSDVRPFYVKDVQTLQDIYAVINGLARWSAKVGIRIDNTMN